MTAPPAAEHSIPARANQACASREAVRSSLTNRSALSARMLHSHPPPNSWELRTLRPRVRKRSQGVLGLPTLDVWRTIGPFNPSSDLSSA